VLLLIAFSISRLASLVLNVMDPAHSGFCSLFNIANVDKIMLEFMSDDLFFHSFIAFVAYFMGQARNPGSTSSEHVLSQRGHALRHLTKALQSLQLEEATTQASPNDLTISAIVYLALLEQLLGNDGGHTLHATNLSHIVEMRGGIDAIANQSTKTLLLTYNSQWELETGISRIPVTWSCSPPPGLSASVRVSDEDVAKLPEGFQLLAMQGYLSHDTLVLLGRGVDLGLSTRSRAKVRESTAAQEQRRPHHSLHEACPVLKAADDDDSMLDKVITLAMILFAHITFLEKRRPQKPPAYQAARAELTRILSSKPILPSPWGTESCVWIWGWMLAIDAWRADSGPATALLPEGHALLRQLLHHCEGALERWDHAKGIVDRFFWSDELDNFWHRHWQQLVGASDSSTSGMFVTWLAR
jgi:hypothetical protein